MRVTGVPSLLLDRATMSSPAFTTSTSLIQLVKVTCAGATQGLPFTPCPKPCPLNTGPAARLWSWFDPIAAPARTETAVRTVSNGRSTSSRYRLGVICTRGPFCPTLIDTSSSSRKPVTGWLHSKRKDSRTPGCAIE